MKKVLALSLFLLALNWTSALFAQQTAQSQNVRYDFNSEQEVKDLLSRKVLRASDNNKVKWIKNPRATGNGALMVDCSHIYRGQIHLSVSDLIPKDSTEGVLSFWIYDDLNFLVGVCPFKSYICYCNILVINDNIEILCSYFYFLSRGILK